MRLFAIYLTSALVLISTPVFAMSCPMQMKLNSVENVQAWRSVNDGVMGGRSSGGVVFGDKHMVFQGIINTNGGGFSSIRSQVAPNVFVTSDALIFRVRADGRAYKATFRTNARYGWRQVSFQAPLPITTPGKWEDVRVAFSELTASVFGRPVRGVNFDKAKVQSIGIILSDGQDGPFELSIAEISACQ